jgi:hypothetical protein
MVSQIQFCILQMAASLQTAWERVISIAGVTGYNATDEGIIPRVNASQ